MYDDGIYRGYIYKITNELNGKVYIGQTRQAPKRRWWQHKESAYDNKYSNLLLYRAMRKYGVGSFSFNVVEAIEAGSDDDLTRDLNKAEAQWISDLNAHGPNGYNMTDGGSDSPKYRSNKVIMVNEDGYVVGKYDSVTIASEVHSINPKTIQHACISKSHYGAGSFWYYAKDVGEVRTGDCIGRQAMGQRFKFGKGNLYGSKPVGEYTKSGELVMVYTSIEDAGRRSGVSECSVRRCLKGEVKSTKGKCFALIN